MLFRGECVKCHSGEDDQGNRLQSSLLQKRFGIGVEDYNDISDMSRVIRNLSVDVSSLQ